MPIFLITGSVLFEIRGGPKAPLIRHPVEISVSCQPLRLTQKIEGLETRNVGKKVTLYFKETANVLISGGIISCNEFSRLIQTVALQLRSDMKNTRNSFRENFQSDCQVNAVPTRLLTFVSMLIDGCGSENQSYSQRALTMTQMIQTNYRDHTHNEK